MYYPPTQISETKRKIGGRGRYSLHNVIHHIASGLHWQFRETGCSAAVAERNDVARAVVMDAALLNLFKRMEIVENMLREDGIAALRRVA